MSRGADLERFYAGLQQIEHAVGGARTLAESTGRMEWPGRGVYFFMEQGELREGDGLRVVRVGTHALKAGSQTTLWKRLSQHQGTQKSGGGNHRGSIFRLITGTSLMKRDNITCETWGRGNSAPRDIREGEVKLELQVSRSIGAMPFLWLDIPDEPGPESLRGAIERHSIALLSNFQKLAIDPPSENWLGHHCDRDRVRQSGLWNSNHVDETYDPAFLDVFEELVDRMAVR